MTYDNIVCSRPAQHVFEIRFNHPERLNAVDETVVADLNAALDSVEKDKDVRVVILSGEGRAFCAGANYKRHVRGDRTMYEKREYVRQLLDTCRHLYRFPKPIIAAVQGYSVGVGAEMCLNCDFIVMAENAELGFPEVAISTFVGGGVTKTLARLVGLSKAREMIMLSDRITGKQAVEFGLAARCVPEASLRDETLAFARRLAEPAPVSVSLAKQLINSECDYDDLLSLEREAILTCMMTEDWHEGVKAFAEKRTPVFKGR